MLVFIGTPDSNIHIFWHPFTIQLINDVMHVLFVLVRVYMVGVICAPGILFHQARLYKNAFLLFCCASVWNDALKQWFAVPFNPEWGDFYGFPSGHMHAFTLFYGYLSHAIRKRWRWIFWGCVCAICACDILYCNCHTGTSVFGGLLFGCAELPLILKCSRSKRFPFILFVWSCISFALCHCSPNPMLTKPAHPFLIAAGMYGGLLAIRRYRWLRWFAIPLLIYLIADVHWDWLRWYVALPLLGFTVAWLPNLCDMTAMQFKPSTPTA